MLGYPRLHKDGRSTWIEACREPVRDSLMGELFDELRILVLGCQCMKVCDKEKALVFVLEFYPVAKDAVKMAKVELSSWTHSRENSLVRFFAAQQSAFPSSDGAIIRSTWARRTLIYSTGVSPEIAKSLTDHCRYILSEVHDRRHITVLGTAIDDDINLPAKAFVDFIG